MENSINKSLEIFNDENYEGCAIRHTAKNSEVYMPYHYQVLSHLIHV